MEYFVPPHVFPNPGVWEWLDEGARKERQGFTLEEVVDRGEVVIWDCEETTQLRRVLADKSDPVVVSVEKIMKGVLSALKEELGRDGITGRGDVIHVNLNFGKNYPNAFWNGKELTLGTGDGKVFSNFVESIDVMAHEVAHGVVQHTASLVYQGESGALNEHFADVFGTVIQRLAEPETRNNWLIGDEICLVKGEALRSMSWPGCAYDNAVMGRDPQPAHMRNLYEGEGDNGGVHINSGIPNRVFYLVAEEVGVVPAAKMWYEVLLRLEGTSNFRDFGRELSFQAANRVGWAQLVRWALREVGIS